jgi:protein-L-isoaspartate(D-aspartate) O-methyltransferase
MSSAVAKVIDHYNGIVEPEWEALREAMVETQLRGRGIHDSRVLSAMRTVPRHEFVPAQDRFRAYDDNPLPIERGQTISQPYIVGFMPELLQLEAGHRVLEVGTGSGYQTAILATLAREVFTIDIHAPLVDVARARLASSGFTNIRFDLRNGHLGWPEFAPFDRIMVTAGAPFIPQALIEQLGESGRMVIPVGAMGGDQILKLVVKHDSTSIDVTNSVPVRFVPLLNAPDEVT